MAFKRSGVRLPLAPPPPPVRPPSPSSAVAQKRPKHKNNWPIRCIAPVRRPAPQFACCLWTCSYIREIRTVEKDCHGTGDRAADGAKSRAAKERRRAEARHVCRRRRAVSARHARRGEELGAAL